VVEFWGDLGFLLFAASVTVFTFLYLSMSRWYKSFVGTIIAIFSVCVTILCVYLSLRIWEIPVPAVDWIRLILFWILGITMVTSVIGFLEIQFGRRGQKLRNRMARRYDDVRK
jgi:TRAP-type C4-dicarboxylate transport system permease small subunit